MIDAAGLPACVVGHRGALQVKINSRRFALCCGVLAVIDGPAPRQTAQAQDHALKPAPARRAPARGRTGSPPAAPSVEQVDVHAGIATANGVNNTTPGGGLMQMQTAPRSTSGITRDFIAKQSPTSNVQSLIADLPGVVAASNDPLGLTGDSLSIRGFYSDQIGYLFEGAPVADPVNYQPYTNILVDTENLGSVTVTQGSPDIAAPLYNAVGGQISASEIDPPARPGGYVEFAGGSNSASKAFVRLNAGEIGNSGIRGFGSFSYTSADNWRGPGSIHRYHVDAKLVKKWGDGNSAKLVFAWNHTQYTSYVNPTLSQWQQNGRNNNFDASYTPGDANYYKLNSTQNNAVMVIAPVSLRLASGVQLNLTPYYLNFFGPSEYAGTLSQTGSFVGSAAAGNLNQPFATDGTLTVETVDPYIQRTGALSSSVDWTWRNNLLQAGYLYSYTNHDERASFATVDYQGRVSNSTGRFAIVDAAGQQLSGFNINFKQQVNTLFVADTLHLLGDRLSVTAGLKAAMVDRISTNLLPGSQYYNSGNYFEPLPEFYASYRIDPQNQFYVNATTAFRAPASVEAYSQIYSPSQPTPVEQATALQPEYSIGEEVGYRHTGFINVSIALFNYNLTHFQVTSSAYVPGSTQLISEPLDAGGETARGVQAEVGLGHWHHFSPYVSGQYLHATDDNNYNAGNDYLPTRGKDAVLSPHFTGSLGLSYDDGHVFGNFDVRYVDSQYSTFMNDESIPAYWTTDMTLGYRFGSIGRARHPQIQLNLANLADTSYLSGVAGISGNAVATRGVFGNIVAASAPNYFVGAGFAALVSVSAGF